MKNKKKILKEKLKDNQKDNQKWIFLGIVILLITVISCVLINATFKQKNINSNDKNASSTTSGKYTLHSRNASNSLYKLYDFTGKTLKLVIRGKSKSVSGNKKGYILYKDNKSSFSSFKDEKKENYVYCIELGVNYQNGQKNVKNKSDYFDKMLPTAKSAIEYINIFGYPGVSRNTLVKDQLSSSHKDDKQLVNDIQYLATQSLIWEFQQGWRDNYNAGMPQYTDAATGKLTTHETAKLMYNKTIGANSEYGKALKAVHDKILADISKFKTKPSFSYTTDDTAKKHVQTLKYNSYGEAGKGYKLVLTDTNNVLKDMKVSCPSSVTCKVDGKTLTITSSKELSSDLQIKLTKTKNSEVSTTQKGLSFVDGGGSGSQRLIVGMTSSKTLTRYLYVKTEQLGSITIKKTTSDPVAGTFTFRIKGEMNSTGYIDKKITTTVKNDESTGEVTINYLPLKKYIIEEINVPTKYVPTDSIEVKLTSSSNKKTVKFENDLKTAGLTIKKIDENKVQISGASLELKDSSGKVVAQWTSGKKTFKNLEVGNYKVCETKAPAGYVKATECYDINISGTKDATTVKYKKESASSWTTGSVLKFPNNPTTVTIKKVDKDGKAVEGAKLRLVDKNGNQVSGVDDWTESTHVINGLTIGETYIVKELDAPKGYLYSSNQEFKMENNKEIKVVDNIINIKVVKKSSNQKDYPIKTDGLLLALCEVGADCKTNSEDRIEQWSDLEHTLKNVSELQAGKKYKIVEVKAPKGFNIASDTEITINKTNTSQTFEIVNTPTTVTFSKQDYTTSKEIEGAHLQIIDTNGNVVEEWTSEKDKSHVVTGKLEYGSMYTLKETIAPSKYAVSKEVVEFWVGDASKVVMKNKLTEVIIRKTDANSGETLAGAKLQLVDSDGKQIDWTSTKEGYKFEGLITGKKYTIKEIEAPNGYEKAEDITFTLADDEQKRTIDVPNTPIVIVPDTASDSTIINIIVGVILILGGGSAVILIRKGMVQNQ